jgi:hypothetical protein
VGAGVFSLDACTAHPPSQVAAACVMMAFDYFAQPRPSPASLAGLHVHGVAAAAADVCAAVHFVHGELREHNIPPGCKVAPALLSDHVLCHPLHHLTWQKQQPERSERAQLRFWLMGGWRGAVRVLAADIRSPWGAQQVRGSRAFTEAIRAQATRQPVRRCSRDEAQHQVNCWVHGCCVMMIS